MTVEDIPNTQSVNQIPVDLEESENIASEYGYYGTLALEICIFLMGLLFFPIWGLSIFCINFEDKLISFISKVNVLLCVLATILFFVGMYFLPFDQN